MARRDGGENGAPRRLAAVMFDRDEDVDAAVIAFVDAARRAGARLVGFVQEHGEAAGCDRHDAFLRDLANGEMLHNNGRSREPRPTARQGLRCP